MLFDFSAAKLGIFLVLTVSFPQRVPEVFRHRSVIIDDLWCLKSCKFVAVGAYFWNTESYKPFRMDQLGKKLSLYVITILLVVGGAAFLFKYIGSVGGDGLESQPLDMLVGGLAMIVAGILTAPGVIEKMSRGATLAVGVVGALVALFLAWSVFYSVDEEMEFQAQKAAIEGQVIQRLKDIREAQEAYATANGSYTSNFDTLIDWIYKPEIMIPFRMGTFHDSLPEEKAIELGYVIKRDEIPAKAEELGMDADSFRGMIDRNETPYKVMDTLYTSFYEENFAPEKRRAKKQPLVSLDSLPFSPSSGERWIIRTGSVEKGGLQRPTILVMDPTPFGREKVRKDTLRFGSLDEPITDGNWK